VGRGRAALDAIGCGGTGTSDRARVADVRAVPRVPDAAGTSGGAAVTGAPWTPALDGGAVGAAATDGDAGRPAATDGAGGAAAVAGAGCGAAGGCAAAGG
jgi:hypothetical protein